jgi:ABC-type Fe3+-hydroxamate transport system substrate-binding protein
MNDVPALIDATGAVHAPAGPAPRIACFVPSITELIVDLGLADRLVARTQFCIHPAAAMAAIPAVGGTKKASLPKLRALAPTHAILNVEENTREMDAAMREFVPHVVVTYPRRPEDNAALYRLIGGLFGREREAEALVARFESAMAALRAATAGAPPRRVLYLIWKEPWMTISRGNYIAETLALLNWHPVVHADDTAYPEAPITADLLAATDLVLFSSEPYAFGAADLDEFAARYGCARAKLHLVDGEYCSWYGSRAIPAMRYLAELAARIGR